MQSSIRTCHLLAALQAAGYRVEKIGLESVLCPPSFSVLDHSCSLSRVVNSHCTASQCPSRCQQSPGSSRKSVITSTVALKSPVPTSSRVKKWILDRGTTLGHLRHGNSRDPSPVESGHNWAALDRTGLERPHPHTNQAVSPHFCTH